MVIDTSKLFAGTWSAIKSNPKTTIGGVLYGIAKLGNSPAKATWPSKAAVIDSWSQAIEAFAVFYLGWSAGDALKDEGKANEVKKSNPSVGVGVGVGH